MGAFSLVYLSCGIGPASAQVAGPEVYQALERSPKVRVVVALRPPSAAPTDHATVVAEIQAIQNRVLAPLSPQDFTLTHRWDTISGFAGELSRSGLDILLTDPEVVQIDLDDGGGGGSLPDVGADLIQADGVQALGFTGQGVTVAVMDSGIDTNHPDLSSALVAEQCFCTNSDGTGCCPNHCTQQSGAGSAEDDNGHGTNVAGIIASAGIVAPMGVAPKAKLVAIKVTDSQGKFASSSQVISALNWIITNRPEVKIVNMSLGTSTLFSGACDTATAYTRSFAQAINTLRSKGAMVFAASLNNASASQMGAPACVGGALSVGAVYAFDAGPISKFGCTDTTTAADKMACFSNSNSTLQLVAPGAPITSTGMGGGTSTYYGTSQASPHAAGGAALLLEANPGLTTDQIEATLKSTGVSVTDPKNGFTFPRIDLLASVKSVTPLPSSPPTPLSPSGSLSTRTPSFSWTAVPGATRYHLWVDDSTGNILTPWYTAGEASCGSGTGTCTVSPGRLLAYGPGDFAVQAETGTGTSAWSSVMTFMVAAPAPPSPPTPLSPSGSLSTRTPSFSWTAVPGATRYHLWVDDSTGNILTPWYTAGEASCGSGTGTCTVSPGRLLAYGPGDFAVQAETGTGTSAWSSLMTFTVAAQAQR